MLDYDRVLSLFSLFTDLTGDSLARWEGLCQSAARRLEARLRPSAEAEAEMEGLCAAAAAMAYGDYLLLGSAGAGTADEIRVGDISLKNSVSHDTKRDAEEIRAYFLNGVAHLLLPECPALLAVGGAE